VGQGGAWSVGGPLASDEAPVLARDEREEAGFGVVGQRPLRLVLSARPVGDTRYRVELTARDAAYGVALSHVSHVVDAAQVDGGLALVSHRGPEGSQRGHWFRGWRLEGDKLDAHPERAFGPLVTAQYTVHRGALKLTAQLVPLDEWGPRRVTLEVRPAGGEWRFAAATDWVPRSYTATFRVDGWDATTAHDYRLRTTWHGRGAELAGTITAEPDPARAFTLAAFTGHKIYTGGLRWNADAIWMPHADIVSAVQAHAPDLLFFSGDQVYEGDLTPATQGPFEAAMLDYLYKWYRWCWSFRDLTTRLPAVTIPDDHDVYHGNIWGNGGVTEEQPPGKQLSAQDRGGYKRSTAFVNAVHRTQVSHLPDPYDPTPIARDISVYYTALDWGGLSFAVLADRQFKSSPSILCPEGDVVNGWARNPDWDPVTQSDVPGAVLLGERQLGFLEHWAGDWGETTWMKVALSQTIFANVATLPATATSDGVVTGLAVPEPGVYVEGDARAADGDSNGWPRAGRDRALRVLRKAYAVHVAGDQHLGSTIQYGVDDHRDAGFALCVPSVGNTFPRRWFPEVDGARRAPGAPRYAGDFEDGFGNRITVHAVSNPVRTGREPAALHDRMPGYGIARFEPALAAVSLENWPRGVDPTAVDAAPYPGWPVEFGQLEGGPAPTGYLPAVEVAGTPRPVVQVVDERTGEVLYTVRAPRAGFTPPVFGAGPFTLRSGPSSAALRELGRGIAPVKH
jgi:phosphodiesterase/alkaline phosphatase D-like protein